MNDFVFRKIWIPIDANGDGESQTIAGKQALAYLGGEVMFCLGLFNRMPAGNEVGEFLNHNKLASFLLKIRQGSYASTTLKLDSSTAGAEVEIDGAVTEQQFSSRAKAPIQIYLPRALTANLVAETLFMTFTGATTDKPTEPDVFGRGKIEVIDVGLSLADAVAPAGVQAASTDMVQALFQQTVKYGKNPPGKTATFVSRNNRFGRPVGCDDNGNALANLERY